MEHTPIQQVNTHVVTIYMAGDIDTAKRWLRRECYERGLCVTVYSTDFIYTGGEEIGFCVGFVNYPRFPSTTEDLFARARQVACSLIVECCQRSALIVGTHSTEWISGTPPGARAAP